MILLQLLETDLEFCKNVDLNQKCNFQLPIFDVLKCFKILKHQMRTSVSRPKGHARKNQNTTLSSFPHHITGATSLCIRNDQDSVLSVPVVRIFLNCQNHNLSNWCGFLQVSGGYRLREGGANRTDCWLCPRNFLQAIFQLRY